MSVKKEVRGVAGQSGAAAEGGAVAGLAAADAGSAAAEKPKATQEQKIACSLDAMLNGGECEACQ